MVGANITVTPSVSSSNGVFDYGSGTVPDALNNLHDAIQHCLSLSGTTISTNLSGQDLTAGVYSISGNAELSNSSPLTLKGDENSVFIFNIAGDLFLEMASRIALDGVLPQKIFWNVSGKIFINESTLYYGVFMSEYDIENNGHNGGMASFLSLNGSVYFNDFYLPGVGGGQFYSTEMMEYEMNRSSSTVCVQPGAWPASGPNLIVNHSFEEMVSCPSGYYTILPNVTQVCFWNAPANSVTQATPDYFNSCHTSNINGIPNNFRGPQQALNSGNGYTGIYALGARQYREYIMQELLSSNNRELKPQRHYYGEFYANLGDPSGKAINSLGMYLTENLPTFHSAAPYIISATPQIQSNTVINNKQVWTRISGSFQASGGEKYIIIGNFNDDASSGIENVTGGGNGADANAAYYFIEDVGLYEVPYAGETPACATTFTLGSGVPLPSHLGNITYSWTKDNNPTPFANTLFITVSPTQNSIYTLEVKIDGITVGVSSVAVAVAPPIANAGSGLIICEGKPYQLTGFSPAGGTWSGPNVTAGGLFTPQIDGFSEDFLLTYTVTNPCGTTSDVIKIRVEPVVPVTVQILPAVCATSAPFNLTPPIAGSGTWYGPGITDAINGTFDPAVTNQGPVRIYYYPSWNTDNCETYAYDINVRPASCCPGYFSNNPDIPAELGDPNVLTTLSGNLVFDGWYHITGVLKLENGTFTLKSGTKFYFEGEGVDPGVDNYIWTLGDGRTSLLLENATFEMHDGVTLTSPCNNMWGGIVLLGNSIIKSNSSKIPTQFPSGITYNEISHAMEPIKTYDPSNGTAPYIQNELYMYYTNFRNNMNGIEFVSDMQAKEGLFNCHFSTENSEMKPPAYNVSGHIGARLTANNSSGSVPLVQHCTFDNLNYALEIDGQNVEIAGNNFTRIYHSSIQSGSAQNLAITGNSFTVTSQAPSLVGGDFSLNNNTTNFNSAPTAIMLWSHALATITGNTIEGDILGGSRKQIGIQNTFWSPYQNPVRTVVENNVFRRLDEGIRGLTRGSYPFTVNGQTTHHPLAQATIRGNLFEDNPESIVFTTFDISPDPNTLQKADLILTCNTFDVTGLTSQAARALLVKSGLHMNDLGSATAPNGNKFTGFKASDEKLRNDGVNSGLTYFRYNPSNHEAFGPTQTPGITVATGSNGLPVSDACTGYNNGATARYANNTAANEKAYQENSLMCYPNPATSETTISYKLPENTNEAAVIITSLSTGQSLKQFKAGKEGNLKVDTRNLAAGVYGCTLIADGLIIKTVKLVVMK